ncbi:MAG: heme exporter protein D [Flavobacteriales bacterium]|jgi:heme exporter protein D
MTFKFRFDSFQDFLAMGGDAFYIWLAYGLFALCIISLVVYTKVRRNRIIKKITKFYQTVEQGRSEENRQSQKG